MTLEHVHPLQCALFAMSLYLFWRFDVDGDRVPDFANRSDWYTASILTGQDETRPYTSDCQYHAVKTMHRANGISGHTVHACRVSSSMLDARNRCEKRSTSTNVLCSSAYTDRHG